MASATPAAKQASPQPAVSFQPSSPPNKRDLKSWWKGFILPSKNQEQPEARVQGIFGVPLRQSITYANVAISLINENGQSYIYGYVPIVVAKCGVFLKEKATGVEGIFRLSGSEKRIKELKSIFDSPNRYGKGLVWDGYTVHDAANVLRRYLNDLPEPVVPLDLYEKFRDPLRGATKQVTSDGEGPQFVADFDEKVAIRTYQQLITQLPPLNRQLLLYILDLLAVFAAKSEENRMTSQNLAAIFQPGMLSHPQHAMAPEEYRLNQCVIIFLIENQDHFLIGMQGTAADENTVKEVQSGTPKGPLSPVADKSTDLNRSGSNASAGAESVRRDGQLRRNRSVSSKNSKKESRVTPNAPATATSSSGGLSRSNTVPSKKSPAVAGGKFAKTDRDASSGSVQPLTPARLPQGSAKSGPSTALAVPQSAAKAPGNSQDRVAESLPDRPPAVKERSVSNLFQRNLSDGTDKRQPNKLRKKRIPGTVNLSAQSSSNSLPHSNTVSPNMELANPMESPAPLASAMAVPTDGTRTVPLLDSKLKPPQPTINTVASTSLTEPRAEIGNSQREKTDSPSSMHSSHGLSDPDQTGDEQLAGSSQSPGNQKRKRWLLRNGKREESSLSNSDLPAPKLNLGLNKNAETSTTSFSSSGRVVRKSFQADGSETALSESYDGKDSDGRGPIGWIKHKYREAKENAEQKRNKSPPPPISERQSIGATILGRGKSLDIKREESASETARTEPTSKVEETGTTQQSMTARPAVAIVTTAPEESAKPAVERAVEHGSGKREQSPVMVETIKENPAEEEAASRVQQVQSIKTLAPEAVSASEAVRGPPSAPILTQEGTLKSEATRAEAEAKSDENAVEVSGNKSGADMNSSADTNTKA